MQFFSRLVPLTFFNEVRKTPKTYLWLFLSLGFLLLGILFRSLFLSSIGFGFDQVQIAQNASLITEGKLTLIGPRTGPADMFTGPLIYYLAAAFMLVLPSASAVLATSAFLAAISGIVLSLLAVRYLQKENVWFLIALWAFSPLLIHLDRVPWNPNLSFLAASLVFFPLLKEKGWKLIDIALIGIGIFLGYQAHFSGFALVPFAMIGLFAKKRYSSLLVPPIALALSLVPTLLFDLRHDWLNARGILRLFSSSDSVQMSAHGEKVLYQMYIVTEVVGRLFTNHMAVELYWAVGITFWIACAVVLIQSRKTRIAPAMVLSLSWVGAVLAGYSLYKLSTPEYYYLLLFPAFFMLAVTVIGVKLRPFVAALLFMYSLLIVIRRYGVAPTEMEISTQLKIRDEIVRLSKERPIAEVVFDMREVDAFGIKHWIKTADIQYATEGDKIHISYPHDPDVQLPAQTSFTQKSILWIDERKTEGYTYWPVMGYYIGLPASWSVATAPPENEAEVLRLVFTESVPQTGVVKAVLASIVDDSVFKEEPRVAEDIPVRNEPGALWEAIRTEQASGYRKQLPGKRLFVESSDSSFLSQIEVLY